MATSTKSTPPLKLTTRHHYYDPHTHTAATGLPPKPAAFVAFNPGFGHPNLTKGWKPTLDAALGQHSPCSPLVLWTAHSPADQARDVAFLDAHFAAQQGGGAVVDWLLAPMTNPFASRKRVAGGVGEADGAVVQANQFVGVFRVRRL